MSDAALAVSDRAPRIRRGVSRHFARLGTAVLTEMPLANGRRADVVALDLKGSVAIVEIKSSVADLRADHKWPDYRAFCDRFYFAVDADFPQDRLPDGTGVVVADGFEAIVVREAPRHPLVAARRKAVTLRFARLAAARLLGVVDPDAAAP